MSNQSEVATFAGGCFWCTEAIFTRIKGVKTVTPGYAGGNVEQPTYDQVSMGKTGHAEAIQITFDPTQTSYSALLDIFLHTHNPTTLNQQGNDVGPQYRSVIFYHSPAQKELAESSLNELETAKTYSDPIVTEIVPFKNFYPAEAEHLQYYQKHQDALYCDVVITPKIQKLLKNYKPQVKDEFISDDH